MKFWPLIFVTGIFLFAGCARFQPQPVSAAKTFSDFDVRSLTNENLRAFLETNYFNGAWDLSALTLVAFFYQPALAEARAHFTSAQAAEITAGGRPNPTVGFTPTYDTTTPPPWIVGLTWDIPIETAGKRGKRIAQAKKISETAKWNFISAAWQTRSQVRAALLNLYIARENENLFAQQEMAQSNVVHLFEGQFSAGTVSDFEVTQARVIFETTELARLDAIGQGKLARVQLAAALGLPMRALDDLKISFDDLKTFPRDLTAPEIRRVAILNRADVRGALAEYEASQSALQLEIAKQFPDVHLNPGYELDQTDNKYSLGVTVELPVLNQNQGGIAEAKAKRTEAAAHFLTVQANAISEIDSALTGYDAALKKLTTAKKLSADLQKQLNSMRAQNQAGEIEPLVLANAEVEFFNGARNQLGAQLEAQRALGQLEDAVQSPLTLPPNAIATAQNNFSEISK